MGEEMIDGSVVGGGATTAQRFTKDPSSISVRLEILSSYPAAE